MTQRATPPGEPGRRLLVDRVVDVATRAYAWTDRYTQSAQAWAQRQETHSRTGVAVGWFGRYRQADGQQFALLLAAYFFVTLLPAAIAVATSGPEGGFRDGPEPRADAQPALGRHPPSQRAHARLGATAVPPRSRLRRMPFGTRSEYPSQLRCVQCGLGYSQAAVAREMTLATGVQCRRCGGGLHQTDEAPAERTAITAMRSSVSGSGRRRFD